MGSFRDALEMFTSGCNDPFSDEIGKIPTENDQVTFQDFKSIPFLPSESTRRLRPFYGIFFAGQEMMYKFTKRGNSMAKKVEAKAAKKTVKKAAKPAAAKKK